MQKEKYYPGTVGERIRDYSKNHKITQAKLAQKTGIPVTTLSRYMTNDRNMISHEAIQKIAKALGVSTDFLLGFTDTPERVNYDIEELGLSISSAKKLYTGEVDPHIVNQMLENKYFIKVIELIHDYVTETQSAAYALQEMIIDLFYLEKGATHSGT